MINANYTILLCAALTFILGACADQEEVIGSITSFRSSGTCGISIVETFISNKYIGDVTRSVYLQCRTENTDENYIYRKFFSFGEQSYKVRYSGDGLEEFVINICGPEIDAYRIEEKIREFGDLKAYKFGLRVLVNEGGC